jgi:hypothetical protein
MHERFAASLLLAAACAALAGGCDSKVKCVEAPLENVFDGAAPSTLEALQRAQKAANARVCGTVDLGDQRKEPGSLLFSGTMPSAWVAIEDELLKEGWVRSSQTKDPKADDTLFQVSYSKKDWPKRESTNAPRLELQLYTGNSCSFGDVCVRGRQLGQGRQN